MRFTPAPLVAAFLILCPGILRAQVARIELTPARARTIAGEVLNFRAIGRDASGRETPLDSVQWAIGPFEVATVDSKGTVRTFRAGNAQVLAILRGGVIGRADIEIAPKPAAAVNVTADATELVVGGLTRVLAEAFTNDREPRRGLRVMYRSADEAIATVDESGVVTAHAPGIARISAETGGVSGTVSVRVVPNRVATLEVSGAPRTRTGDVVRFTATGRDAAGGTLGNPPVRWMLSGPGATIDADGGFVAERAGSYVVTALAGSVSASRSITVAARTHAWKVETIASRQFGNLQAGELWPHGNVVYVTTVADRVYAYDISDPTNPTKVDSLMVDAHIVNDVMTTADGRIGVISREGASSRRNGIMFLDLSDPLHPKKLSEYTETVSGGVHSAFVDGHYVYLTDDATRSMRVIDFQDAKNPREVARWEIDGTTVYSDPATGSVSGRYLHDIQVKDGLAYLAYFKHGMIILDVGAGIKGGSPENPKFVSQFTYNVQDFYPADRLAGTHSVFRYRNYVFISDEVFPPFYDIAGRERIPTMGEVHVIDVSDIERPRKVAGYHVPEQGSHNLWVEDDKLYIGNFEAGVRVVDVSGELRGELREQGREIGSIFTGSPKGYRVNLPMTWSAIPHRGYIYASDINSGFWVGKLTPVVVP
jgi:hypothetical protein